MYIPESIEVIDQISRNLSDLHRRHGESDEHDEEICAELAQEVHLLSLDRARAWRVACTWCWRALQPIAHDVPVEERDSIRLDFVSERETLREGELRAQDFLNRILHSEWTAARNVYQSVCFTEQTLIDFLYYLLGVLNREVG